MLKKFLYLIVLLISNIFAMQQPQQPTFPYWSQLPKDIRQNVLSYIKDWKFDIDNPATIIDSYKKYAQEYKKLVNKDYRNSLHAAFKSFLRNNLKTEEDIKKLSDYIINSFGGSLLTHILGTYINVNLLFSLMNLLVEINKFDVKVKNSSGSTVLMLAIGSKSPPIDLIKLLIKKGAEINEKNNGKQTALIYASIEGTTEIAKLLLDAGADVYAQDNLNFTALDYATHRKHTEVVNLIKAEIEKRRAKIEQDKEKKRSQQTPRSCEVM
ncbi:ankyrin repeat domain-containing protein [Candidatus Dependentiae bacterium]|nr:ankyrin repeat domain-containing protein [Candidatus Dependentiae bacterium]